MKQIFKLLVDRLAEYGIQIYDVGFNSARHWAKYRTDKMWLPEDRRGHQQMYANKINDAFTEYEDFVVTNLVITAGSITVKITFNNHVFVIEFRTNGNVVIDYTDTDPDFYGQSDVWYELLEGRKVRLHTLDATEIFWHIKDHQLVVSRDLEEKPDPVTSFYDYARYSKWE